MGAIFFYVTNGGARGELREKGPNLFLHNGILPVITVHLRGILGNYRSHLIHKLGKLLFPSLFQLNRREAW